MDFHAGVNQRRWPAVSLTVLVVALAAFVLLQDTFADADKGLGPSTPSAPEEVKKRFALLAKDEGSGILVVSSVDEAMQRRMSAQRTGRSLEPIWLGEHEYINLQSAREARVSNRAGRVWAASNPADGGVCVLLWPRKSSNGGPAASCGGEETATRGVAMTYGGLAEGTRHLAPNEQVVAGIVPDNVRTVRAKFAGAAAVEIKAEDNAFVATLPLPAAGLTYTLDGVTVDLLRGTDDGA